MTAKAAAAGSMAKPPAAELADRSIEVLLAGQAPTGAFIAAPDFEPYSYAWLRDGTFCAYALDLYGRHDEAAAFYTWVAKTLEPLAGRVDDLVQRAGAGKEIPAGDFLPTRFTLEGDALDDGWPNFQLDGYGTWLWGLGEHVRLARDDRAWDGAGGAVELTCRYLEAFATHACYDCWEEGGDRVHTSTLA
ncbi:MAG: glycoside hydrolase family 15 protein, partial [Acidimicrobiales bacterium]